MTVFPTGTGLALHHYDIAELVRAIATGIERFGHRMQAIRQRRMAIRSIRSRCAPLLLVACISSAMAGEASDAAATDARVANGWRVVRVVDCARCHGRDYSGLAAPSIIAYARSATREAFMRMVLDGDPARGMPAYRSNAYVVESADDIYRYFVARAKGEIGPEYRPVSVEPR